jgi:hypothetical protein
MRTFRDVMLDQLDALSRRPWRALRTTLLALMVGAVALGAVVGLRGGAEAPPPVIAAAPFGDPAGDGGATADPVDGPAPRDDGQPQGGGGQDGGEPQDDGDQGGGGGDPDPDPEPEPEPEPAELVVTPDPVDLGLGDYSGSFTVANAGDEPLQWTAHAKPSVTLSDSGGELGGAGENVVSFNVDPTTLEVGAFSFKIKVVGAGGSVYVDVHGTKAVEKM